jgi:hypothetical protein
MPTDAPAKPPACPSTNFGCLFRIHSNSSGPCVVAAGEIGAHVLRLAGRNRGGAVRNATLVEVGHQNLFTLLRSGVIGEHWDPARVELQRTRLRRRHRCYFRSRRSALNRWKRRGRHRGGILRARRRRRASRPGGERHDRDRSHSRAEQARQIVTVRADEIVTSQHRGVLPISPARTTRIPTPRRDRAVSGRANHQPIRLCASGSSTGPRSRCRPRITELLSRERAVTAESRGWSSIPRD